jgi:hypothetical protein
VKDDASFTQPIFFYLLVAGLHVAPSVFAQPQLKKIRIGISTTSIAFLSIYAAQLKGFYRDEGIDLELILMPATLASSAVLTGDIDYNGAVTGVIAAAVQGRPMKVLISRRIVRSSPLSAARRSKSPTCSPDSRQSTLVSIPTATSAY